MRLTERDRQAIEAVYRYRVLTQVQLEHLVFPGCHPSVAQRRLLLLYQHGYLSRQFLPVRGGILTSPILYILDQKGADVLKAEHADSAIHWTRAHHAAKSLFYAHMLALNDVRIALTVACRVRGYRIVTWTGEREMKNGYDFVIEETPAGRAERMPVLPDSYFAFVAPHTDAKQAAHFFVELDRGTETTKRFCRKIRAYIAYVKSVGYTTRYGTKSLRVLTVTTGARRLKSLKAATERVGGHSRFWFTTLDTLSSETALTDPIWYVAGRPEPCSLVSC